MATTANAHYDNGAVLAEGPDSPETPWSITLTKGIFLVILGLIMMAWPIGTLASIIWLIGLFSIIGGIIEMISGLVHINTGRGVLALFLGMLGIILGVLIFRYPGISYLVYVYLFGIWLIISGFITMFSRAENSGVKFLKVLAGILYVAAGIMLLNAPVVNSAALFWVLGLFALVAGPVQIALALGARSRQKQAERIEREHMASTLQHSM